MALKVAGRGPQVLAIYAVFAAITTVAMVLRVYTRVRLVKKFGLDDWLALTAWAAFIPCCAFAIAGTHHGTGQHVWEIIPLTELPIGLKFWWLCEPVYVISNMAIKASIAVMLLRLTIDRIHRTIIWATLITTEVYSTFFFFLFVFQCLPSSYFWNQYTGGEGSCLEPGIVVRSTYGYSAIVCLTDWIFATLPFFLVWKLQMNRKTKISVALILAMGAIASTVTIIRIPYLHTLGNMPDFLYATTDVAIWSGVETGLGITAACLATLRPLFRGWLANTRLTTRGGATRRSTHISKPLPWAGPHGQSRGYIRSNSNAGANGARPWSPDHEARIEALGMKGIQKTTRVSVDAYGPWVMEEVIQDLEQGHIREPTPDKELDRESASSATSQTKIHRIGRCHLANMMR